MPVTTTVIGKAAGKQGGRHDNHSSTCHLERAADGPAWRGWYSIFTIVGTGEVVSCSNTKQRNHYHPQLS
jgi:hypothetical protein